jgi:fructose-specific phosphotransferase system IIC component
MERGVVFGGILLFVAVAFQMWVTVRVFRSRLYEPSQKSAQAKLIWFLPVLGAIIAFSVLTTEEQAERRYQADRELRD